MKFTITIILILISQICNTQVLSIKKWQLRKHSRDTVYGDAFIRINTINGDTSKYFKKSNRYLELTKEGTVMVDGHKLGGMTTVCGCGLIPHGYWIEKYRTGILKAQGRYHCNQKIGTWISYYENGQIQKVESYKRPYIEMFTREGMSKRTLKTAFLLEGPYLEYYSNGQLKIEGEYEIVEAFSSIDTVFTLDAETYEPIANEIKGDFWVPKSKKIGSWIHYSDSGVIVFSQYFEVKTWKDESIRDIELRYWDIIHEMIKNE